jgi:hypothetical protein
MSIPEKYKDLSGNWQGVNRLWLTPTEPVRISETTATISPASRDHFLIIRYTWFEEKPQEGMLLLGQLGDQVNAIWIDSWHNGDSMMTCPGILTPEGALSLRGSYPAPPGPDWGWRIELAPGEVLRICMFNILPDGQEYLAVEAIYTRQVEQPAHGTQSS